MVGYDLTAKRTILGEVAVKGGNTAWIDSVCEYEVLDSEVREAKVGVIDDSIRPPALCV